MISHIKHEDKILAIVISSDHCNEGVEFFTPDDFSQQLAYMKHKKGHVIDAHVHNSVAREIFYTKEVLIIKKGKVRVDFYDDDKKYLDKSIILQTGDLILLAYGGHGFEVLEDLEMIEVKQGPFVGDGDKIRFKGINSCDAVVKNIEEVI